MGRCRTRQDKAKENKSRKRNESRFIVKAGYKGGTEKKQDIYRDRNQYAEPKNGIIVIRRYVPAIGYRRDKTTLLQRAGYQSKNREHTHQSIIGGREQTG